MKPLPLCVVLATLLAACGLNVQAPDLFLLKRTGVGRNLTLLVSDDGTIRCNGGPAKPLSDKLLIQARDLSSSLNNDAKNHLRIAPGPHSVALYTVRVQRGTFSFPDTAARTHSDLAQLELFAVQAAQHPCGLSG